LRDRFGHAAFRVHQLRVLGPLLAGRSVLAVLPTGAGKSLCFQLPALMTAGLTLVVSLLISLIQDQVGALRRRSIAAAYLNSRLSGDQRRVILDAAVSGHVSILYCAPERLAALVRPLSGAGREVALLAVDEAHCIVEWGNEFRPVYRRLDRFRYLLGDPVTIALTGSATPGTRAEILQVLRIPDAETVLTSFDRPNLVFRVERVRDDRARFARLRELVRVAEGSSIVYTPTRRLSELVTRALLRMGIRAAPYHAGLTASMRRRVLRAFLSGEAPIVVATSASGWASTRRTCGAWFIGGRPARWRAIIRKRGAPVATGAAPSACWCGTGPTARGATPQRRCDATWPRGRAAAARCSHISESARRPVRDATSAA
jgi:ATP-dependent DNA helicase RecQ